MSTTTPHRLVPLLACPAVIGVSIDFWSKQSVRETMNCRQTRINLGAVFDKVSRTRPTPINLRAAEISSPEALLDKPTVAPGGGASLADRSHPPVELDSKSPQACITSNLPPHLGSVSVPDGKTGFLGHNAGFTRNEAGLHWGKAGLHWGKAGYIEAKLAYIEAKLAYIEAKLAYIEAKLAYIGAKLAYMEAKLAYIEAKLAYIGAKLAYIEAKLAYIEAKLAYIEAM
jgi:hypothetical protein